MFSRRTVTFSVGPGTRPRHCSKWLAPLALVTVGAVALAPAGSAFAAQVPVGLGTAGSFAILAGCRDHQHQRHHGHRRHRDVPDNVGDRHGVDHADRHQSRRRLGHPGRQEPTSSRLQHRRGREPGHGTSRPTSADRP